jgi:ketosteroid isomerase-like protein
MSTAPEVAQAFSGHRFADALPQLAADVHWVLVGAGVLRGREAVREACETTATELAGTTTEFLRFVTVDGGGAVAVDAIGRYTAADGTVSLVSSCDLYEFRDDVVVTITSYTVELDELPG